MHAVPAAPALAALIAPTRRQPRARSGMTRLVLVFAAALCCPFAAAAPPCSPTVPPPYYPGLTHTSQLPAPSFDGLSRFWEAVSLLSSPPSDGDIPDAVFDIYVDTVQRLLVSVELPDGTPTTIRVYGSEGDVAHPYMNGAQVNRPGYHNQVFSASQTVRDWSFLRYEQFSEQSLERQKSAVDILCQNVTRDQDRVEAENSLFREISDALRGDALLLEVAISEFKRLVHQRSPNEVVFRNKINILRQRLVSRQNLLESLDMMF